MKRFQQYITESYTPLQITIRGEIWDSSGEDEKTVPFGWKGNSILSIAKAIAAKVDGTGFKQPNIVVKALSIHSTLEKFDAMNHALLSGADELMNFIVHGYSKTMPGKPGEMLAKLHLDYAGYRDEEGNLDDETLDMEPSAKGRTAEEFATDAAKQIHRTSGDIGFAKLEITRMTLLHLGKKDVLHGGTGSGHATEPLLKALVAAKSEYVMV